MKAATRIPSFAFLPLAWVSLATLQAQAANTPGPAKTTRLPVKLFEQPCVLQGPLDEATLKAIHQISPNQLGPPQSADASIDKAKKSLERLKAAKGFPSSFDKYRDRQAKRLEAQITFLKALQEGKASKKAAPVLAAGKVLLKPKALAAFETLAKKMETPEAATDAGMRGLLEQLFEQFNEAVEADPEEDFHRALRKLNVEYDCAFEDSGEGEGLE